MYQNVQYQAQGSDVAGISAMRRPYGLTIANRRNLS